jgi:soluble lytic murein transglycosylase-like protein
MPISSEYDKVFCVAGKRYNIKKLLLKSIAICESSLDKNAYRFEQLYWDRYMKDKPEWKDKDPKVVSASYGLFQVMYPVSVALGFVGSPEELCDPMTNALLAAKLMRQLIDKVVKARICDQFYWLAPLHVSLARYNGGGWKNPDETGALRNQKYLRKVLKQWGELKKVEQECADSEGDS